MYILRGTISCNNHTTTKHPLPRNWTSMYWHHYTMHSLHSHCPSCPQNDFTISFCPRINWESCDAFNWSVSSNQELCPYSFLPWHWHFWMGQRVCLAQRRSIRVCLIVSSWLGSGSTFWASLHIGNAGCFPLFHVKKYRLSACSVMVTMTVPWRWYMWSLGYGRAH